MAPELGEPIDLPEIRRQQRALDDDIHRLFSYAVFGVTLLVYLCTIVLHNDTDAHEHLFQAWAWLHGHFYVDGLPIHEVATWHGHQYVLHPPLATIVDLPLSLLWGPSVSQSYLSVFIGALCAMLAYRLTQNLWATVFFAFGTVFWYEATLGAAWGFCAVLSCFPTFLALKEAQHPYGSGWKCGIYAGIAALARYDLVMVWPVYWLMLPAKRRAHLLPGLAFGLAVYMCHAYMKYGVPYDKGLDLWYAVDTAGGLAHPGIGPFSLQYLPLNLYTWIFMAPAFSLHFPWVGPQMMGQALIFTSPALLMLVGLTWSDRKNYLLLAAALLSMSGCALVWSNGVQQFGARYWIQALPFLTLLLSRRDIQGVMFRRLTLVSLCLTAWGMASIRLLGWLQ